MEKQQLRNRKRSQRRAIYCPCHGCHLDSVSPKYALYADTAGQLQVRGISSKNSRLLMTVYTTVSLAGEWLEAFWCDQCQRTEWYHVLKLGNREYDIKQAPYELWMNATKVVYPHHNPSVSEYSFRESRGHSAYGMKSYRSIG